MKISCCSFIALSLLLAGCNCDSCTTDAAEQTGSTETASAPAQVQITPVVLSKEYAFSVTGMHCGGCANSLRTVINECAGVMTAAVSYDQSEAVVNVRDDDALTCAMNVAKELGYEVGEAHALPAIEPGA